MAISRPQHKLLHVPPSSWWQPLNAMLVVLGASVGVLTLCILLLVPHLFHPAEDAVILFRFSRNLAQTGQISYNLGGPHAEGATDFLWMLIIAAGFKAAVPPFWLVAVLSVASLVALSLLLLRIAGQRLRPLPALFIIGCFGLCPQIVAAAAGFSVFPFAFLLGLAALFYIRRTDYGLAITCLLLSLLRPDGVVFAAPLLSSALIVYPARGRRAAIFACSFIIPGLIYFLWRWHYFGLLLPLPFLVKSDTPRLLHLFVKDSVLTGTLHCFFAFAFCWFIWRGCIPDRATFALFLCLLVLPNLFYLGMRLDQDVGHRFFVYLPVGVSILIAHQWPHLGQRKNYIIPLGLALWLVSISLIWDNELESYWADQLDSREQIGEQLSHLSRGTLVTTEAGIVPYFSGWISYDAWGLSTRRFAEHLFQPADVATLQPDAILLHAEDNECEPGSDWQTPYHSRTWIHLTRNLVSGAAQSGYELWYTPLENSRWRAHNHIQPWDGNQDCWYLRKGSPRYAGLVSALHLQDSLPAADFQAKFAAEIQPDLRPPAVAPTIKPLHGLAKLRASLGFHLRRASFLCSQLTKATD